MLVFEHEQLHPWWDAKRHAQLQAAVATGAIKRRDKKPWSLLDFMVVPWKKPRIFCAQEIPKLTAEQRKAAVPREALKAHVEMMNQRFKRQR